MGEVEIDFDDRFRGPLLDGSKICTTRQFKKGEVGDHFEAFGKVFFLTNVYEAPLVEVLINYEHMGFDGPADALVFWKKRLGDWDPDLLVWFHWFVPEEWWVRNFG